MAPSQKTHGSKAWYLAQCLASLLGIVLSIYLLVQHTRVKSGIQGGASFCTFGKYANCDVVNASDYAELAGIPIAGIGAVFFFVLLVLCLLAQPADKKFRRTQFLLGWLLVPALFVDAGLFTVQLWVLRSFCILCLATYVVNLVLFLGVIFQNESRGELPALSPSRFKNGAKFSAPATALALIAIASFTMLVALVPNWVRTDAPTETKVQDALYQFFENWKKLPVRNIDVKQDDATFGNPAARVRVVVFSDFQCPFCKKGAFTMNTALQPLKDKIYFVFKHYPLDSSCNPALQYQLHAHACELAKLGYCTRRKGKFWEYHDRVFFNFTESDLEKGQDYLADKLKDLLTRDEFNQCLASDRAKESVVEDIKLGNTLGVRGTPSVFINGKAVTIPLTVENLQKLIELEGA